MEFRVFLLLDCLLYQGNRKQSGLLVNYPLLEGELLDSVFANDPGDLGSISGRVIPKTQKMVQDASLLNTQHYQVRIKGKVEQSRERSSALPYTCVVSYRKGSLRVTFDNGRQLYLLVLCEIQSRLGFKFLMTILFPLIVIIIIQAPPYIYIYNFSYYTYFPVGFCISHF